MAFWKRNKALDETNDYLQATDTVSRPTAFLLSLFAFFVVFVVVFSAILGGRWLWKKASDDSNKSNQTPLVVNNNDSEQDKSADETKSEENNTTTPAAPEPSGTTIVGGGVATNTPNPTPGSSIPTTGPTEVFSLFAATTVAATAAHSRYQKRRS